MSSEYVTPEQVAAACDVSPETIRRLCRAGRMPGAVQVGRSWVIDADDAARFVRDYVPYKPPTGSTDE